MQPRRSNRFPRWLQIAEKQIGIAARRSIARLKDVLRRAAPEACDVMRSQAAECGRIQRKMPIAALALGSAYPPFTSLGKSLRFGMLHGMLREEQEDWKLKRINNDANSRSTRIFHSEMVPFLLREQLANVLASKVEVSNGHQNKRFGISKLYARLMGQTSDTLEKSKVSVRRGRE
jgi:hypothetical protein